MGWLALAAVLFDWFCARGVVRWGLIEGDMKTKPPTVAAVLGRRGSRFVE